MLLYQKHCCCCCCCCWPVRYQPSCTMVLLAGGSCRISLHVSLWSSQWAFWQVAEQYLGGRQSQQHTRQFRWGSRRCCNQRTTCHTCQAQAHDMSDLRAWHANQCHQACSALMLLHDQYNSYNTELHAQQPLALLHSIAPASSPCRHREPPRR